MFQKYSGYIGKNPFSIFDVIIFKVDSGIELVISVEVCIDLINSSISDELFSLDDIISYSFFLTAVAEFMFQIFPLNCIQNEFFLL